MKERFSHNSFPPPEKDNVIQFNLSYNDEVPTKGNNIIAFLETLAEGRSKVKDAKSNNVPVVEKEFLAGVKTEGVVSMIKQHTISEWGHEVEGKIQKARAVSEAGSLKSGGKFYIYY